MKKKYKILKKKYNLPSFEELDNEFEISKIENNKFILQEIRRNIIDKINLYVKILEELMDPESSIRNLHELLIFTDEEKENNFKIYSELMKIIRVSYLINLDNNEKENAYFIKDTFNKWNKIKIELKKIIKKLKEAWEKKKITKEELGYLG